MPGIRSALLVACTTLAAVSCRMVPVHNVIRSNVPPGLSSEFVGEIIEYAATRRGWSVREEGPGHMTASISVRDRHRAVVDITYDSDWFSIQHRSSENLLYDGERIHRRYNGWVIKLEKTIRKELLRAAGRPTVPSRPAS